MKNLTIKYGTITLFSGEVAEVSWTDNEDGVTVTGKTKKASGGNIFDLLSAAAKKQTEEEVEKKKEELKAIRVSRHLSSQLASGCCGRGR
jgi:hypothetical protein